MKSKTLSDSFHELFKEAETHPEVNKQIAELVFNARASAERDGLLAIIYHEGIGIDPDLDKSFEYAEKAAFDGGDAAGYFMLGFMCDNAETPDQATGGPRQKYDQYDAARFYEKCAEYNSRWREPAILWLGEYYLDSAAGGDPDVGVEYLETIAENNADAAGRLSDYYWDLIMPEYFEDEEWRAQLFKWTEVAAGLDPEEYSYRMGWIYADGLGCGKSFEKAFEFFNEAYLLGNGKGAAAIAKIYEELIEENPDISPEDETKYREEIEYWQNLADHPGTEDPEDDVED